MSSPPDDVHRTVLHSAAPAVPAACLHVCDGVGGKFFAESRLGSGGFGTVYRGVNELGQAVAIKVRTPDPDAGRDDVSARRFAREGELHQAVRADCLPAFHGRGQTAAGLDFVAMELIDGRPVSGLLPAADAPWPAYRVVAFGLRLAAAVAELHRVIPAHRDLYPSNLIEAADGRIRVLDLGCARHPTRDEEQTLGSAGFGHPQTMDPTWRDAPQDATSDLFSVGCILFRLRYGRYPFGDCTWAPRADGLVPAGMAAADLPGLAAAPDLDGVLVRLLAPERPRRPTAAQLFDQLRAAYGPAVGLPADGAGRPPPAWVEPYPGDLGRAIGEVYGPLAGRAELCPRAVRLTGVAALVLAGQACREAVERLASDLGQWRRDNLRGYWVRGARVVDGPSPQEQINRLFDRYDFRVARSRHLVMADPDLARAVQEVDNGNRVFRGMIVRELNRKTTNRIDLASERERHADEMCQDWEDSLRASAGEIAFRVGEVTLALSRVRLALAEH